MRIGSCRRSDTIVAGATPSGMMVVGRFAIMLEEGLVTPEYLISPAETRQDHPAVGSEPELRQRRLHLLVTACRSWRPPTRARCIIENQRFAEWSETLNAEAPIISDRLLNGDDNNDPTTHRSLWTADKPGEWGGSLTWNDGHTSYSSSHRCSRTHAS